MKTRFAILGIVSIGLFITPAMATPLGNAFSYQGHVIDDGVPVDGSIAMVFTLYDDEVSGPPLGMVVFDGIPPNPPPVDVANGLFMVELDFGVEVFNGEDRWLELTVDGETVTPRQRITAVPYALQTRGLFVRDNGMVGVGTTDPLAMLHVGGAAGADGLMFPDGTLQTTAYTGGGTGDLWTDDGDDIFNTNAGNVGIGVPLPAERLDVDGTAQMTGFKLPTGATAGHVLTSDAAGTGTWQPTPEGYWSANGDNISNDNAGNVGIGTATPKSLLHLADEVSGLAYPLRLSNVGSVGAGKATGILFYYGTDGLDRGKGGIAYEYSSSWNRGNFHILQNSGGDDSIADLNDAVMTIQNDGYVGIGMTNPDEMLTVAGTMHSTTGGFKLPDGTIVDDAGDLGGGTSLWNEAGSDIYYDSGKVGVGAATPNSRLHVNGDGIDPSLRVQVNGSSKLIVAAGGGVSVGANQTNPPASGLYVAGDVGIGVTSPGARLHVAGAAGTDGIMFPDGTLQTTAYTGGAGGGFWDNNGADIYNTNAGYVGIGTTSPAAGLHVSSSQSWEDAIIESSSTNLTQVRLANTSGGSGAGVEQRFFLQVNGTGVGDRAGNFEIWANGPSGNYNVFASNPAGAVGINRSTPTHQLHVVADGARHAVAGYTSAVNHAGVYGQTSVNPSTDNEAPAVMGVQMAANVLGALGYAWADLRYTIATGVYGEGAGSDYAGYFNGNVNITGMLTKASGSFRIDHPLDPENMTLSHSFVESPDMMNIYNGNVCTDGDGKATIALPDWFEALNRDYRYQLTVIDDSDDFVQAKIAREVRDGSFDIRTSKPRTKVSWQVTGIRQDAYANANRVQVEEDKPEWARGRYLHPEAFGLTRARGIGPHADSAGAD